MRISSIVRLLTLYLPVATGFCAEPGLVCQVSQGGDDWVLEFRPTEDPYRVQAKVSNDNFRFKAVVVRDQEKISYVKLYVHYLAESEAIPLQVAIFSVPAMLQAGVAPAALTGWQALYSPRLGRELRYGCTLRDLP